MYGACAVFSLWSSESNETHFNIQTHATYTSFEGDESCLSFPVMAALGHALSENVLVYGGGGDRVTT